MNAITLGWMKRMLTMRVVVLLLALPLAWLLGAWPAAWPGWCSCRLPGGCWGRIPASFLEEVTHHTFSEIYK
jgi:hypothetical protein